MHLDDILIKYSGEFGKYQAWQYLLVGLPVIFTAMHPLSWAFTGAKMDHRCLYPAENSSTAKYDPETSWYDNLRNITTYDIQCQRISNISYGDVSTIYTEACLEGYVWDRSFMDETAISRWSIVCDRSILRAVIQSFYFVGQLLGSFVLGISSDHLGRKPVFILSIAIQACCGIVMAFVPNWYLFAIFRIGVGFAHPGIFILAVVIGTEMVGPKYRLASSISTGVFWALGLVIIGTFTYPIRDYRYLQLAISIPELVLVVYWWLVPESARWLISRKRLDEADEILRTVAKCNGRSPLPSNWYTNMEKEREPLKWNRGLLALFRTPNLRKRSLINCILWPAVAMGYFGLAINPSFMGGDDRLAFILGGILEIPGLIFVLFTLNFFGRRYLTSFGFILAGGCLLLTLLVSNTAPFVSLLLVLIGKGSLTATFSLVYIMTPEIYPTIIRNTAIGMCSGVARAGAMTASFLSMYIADTNPALVAVTFAVLSIVAGIATLFLPETTGAPLLETVEEAETFGHDQPFLLFGYQSLELYTKQENTAIERASDNCQIPVRRCTRI